MSLATDLAIAYFVARVIFRPQHPVIPFLLLLGIASDALGFVALALFNPMEGRFTSPSGVLILAGAIGIAAVLRRMRVRSFWPYLLGAGSVSWFGFFWSGLHPALALVPIMPFLPHAARDPGFLRRRTPRRERYVESVRDLVEIPGPGRAVLLRTRQCRRANGALEAGTWGLPIAVVVGKPLGLLIGAGLALLAGLHLPHRVGWRELIVGGLIAAMGFSVGLFFVERALPAGTAARGNRAWVCC